MARTIAPTICTLIVAAQFVAFSQPSTIRIAGVDEPPELTGAPKKLTPPSETLRQLADIMGKWKENEPETVKALRPQLDSFIQQHPEFADGYAVRALADACYLKNKNYENITRDINNAIATPQPDQNRRMFTFADLYAYRARLHYEMGHDRESMDDLERAMKQAIDSADEIFHSGGPTPEANSGRCAWNLSDLNALVHKFPKDYRSTLFRALYLSFFTTFDEKYYQQAMSEFQRAATANPKSPLPLFFIGRLYTKASFWTKAAWASDEGKNEPSRKAVLAYTNAIQLDAGFRAAYEMRATAYLQLKRYREAIKDYDRVLQLDPENVTAYADRGLAKLELGQYLGATLDLGDAIRRTKPNDNTLGNSYEIRADAYMKMGDYRNAIADFSKALEQRLANDSFLFSLQQIRGLYPEYNGVSDEVLIKKINGLFWPEFGYDVIAKKLLEENGEWKIGLFHELYEKRGDAYLRSGDFRRGVLDFNRIFKGIPDFADTVERWRLVGASSNGQENYVDVKSVEFPNNGPARLWIKTMNKNKSYMVQSFDVDCATKRINLTSMAVYDKDGLLLTNSEASRGWQRIVPETLGEQLHNGICSATR